MPDPAVTIDLDRIERNARAITTRAAQDGIGIFGVTKGVCGMPQVARAMLRGGVRGLAESRFENIRRLRESGIDAPIMLLRSPPLVRVEELVRSVDVSLQSELPLIREISKIAERHGKRHDIILMVDLGDLREGIWPSELVEYVEQIRELGGVRIAGVGTNLSCVNGILPSPENLGQLVAHAYKIERLTGRMLDYVSGGNSTSLPLLLEGRLPAGINNLRIGEAILLGGRNSFIGEPWDALDGDAFRLTGELIEVKVKPSLPIGKASVDAFGNAPVFKDEGDRLRGIVNIGREDVPAEGLVPPSGIRVVGASSDHLVLDLTDATPQPVQGDTVSFGLSYGAMLAVMTSEYVEKVPMFEPPAEGPVPVVQFHATPDVGAFVTTELRSEIAALGYGIADATQPAPAAAQMIDVTLAQSRAAALPRIVDSARALDALGLIWLDAASNRDAGGAVPDMEGLAALLSGLGGRLLPENIVFVGLRRTIPAEAARLKASRATLFSMVEVDDLGLRHVMREALRAALAGTAGLHLHYALHATEMPGWTAGIGGLSVRETHQAMEAVAASRKLRSLDITGLGPDLPEHVQVECRAFLRSALGSRVL